MSDDIKNLGTLPADDFDAIIAELESGLKAIVESKDVWWRKVYDIIQLIVPEVEKFDAIFSAGADKKAIALDLIDSIYFKYVQINWIPDALEKMVLNTVASGLIDKVVAILNKQGILKHT